MAENRPRQPTEVPQKERYRWPRPPTYRYRGAATNGRYTRLRTVDLDLLRLRPGERVLDVGCGTGRHLIEACRRDCYAVGVEPERDDLTIARGYAYCLWTEEGFRAQFNVLQAVGERLPFRDESFDHLVCTEVLEHVPDDRRLVGEFARLLRPGGTIAVSVPDHLAEAVSWKLASWNGVRMRDHLRVYRRRQVARLLDSAGLRVYARRCRHSLESVRWFLIWLGAKEGSAARRLAISWEDFVHQRAIDGSRVLSALEEAGNLIVPKSLVVYARKEGRGIQG